MKNTSEGRGWPVLYLEVDHNPHWSALQTLVGMHPEASLSKDRYDGIAPPYFLEYTQLSAAHPEFFEPQFVRDVVPTQQEYVWDFTLESNRSGPVELHWDHTLLKNNRAQLLLYDVQNERLVDMRRESIYIIEKPDKYKIQFIYSRDEQLPTTQYNTACPNPFLSEVMLPGFLNINGEVVDVSVSIYTSTGVELYSQAQHSSQKGLVQTTWAGTNKRSEVVPSGLYHYRVRYKQGDRVLVYQGKLIKQ